MSLHSRGAVYNPSMMHGFILFVFFLATSWDFIVQGLKLPGIVRFLPEASSAIIVVYALIAGTRTRFRYVAPKYWLVFTALGLVIVCGIVNNDPGTGPLITGLRFCFRAVPLFFLPAVLPTSEKQLRTQLNVLLACAFAQVPISMYQRWVILDAGRYSGDGVQGSLMDSGILTMFLICAALVLTGFLLKHRIGKLKYFLIFLVLLFPTTINETKATVIFLPVGLIVTLLVGAEPGKRLRYAGLAVGLLTVFAAIFIPIYDKMEEGDPNRIDIVDFFSNEKQLSQYLVANEKGRGAGLGSVRPAHRGESISVPLHYLAKDPVKLAFGLGLGNSSPSQSGKNFEGNYYRLFTGLLVTSFSYFLLEFGVLGVSLIGVLFWLVFADSMAVAREDTGIHGALAAGFTGIVALFIISTAYNCYHLFTSMTFLYWYFSGLVCARRAELRYASAPAVVRPARTALLNTAS